MLTVLALTFRALESAGVETRLCNRREYEEELIKWADVIFTAGKLKLHALMVDVTCNPYYFD